MAKPNYWQKTPRGTEYPSRRLERIAETASEPTLGTLNATERHLDETQGPYFSITLGSPGMLSQQ